MAARLIGGVYVLTAVAVCIFYLPCLKAIGFDPQLKDKSCFRIMFNLGISDLIMVSVQLIFHLAALISTYGALPAGLSCYVAPLVGCCWFSSSTFLLILSINRLSIITDKLTYLFSKNCTTVLIVLTWLYTFGWFVVMEMDVFCYYPSTYSFYYNIGTPLGNLAKTVNWFHNQLTLWPAVLCYIIAFYVTRNERKQAAEAFLQDSMREQELQLLKQGATIFGYHFIQAEYWHLAGPFLYGKGFEYAFALGNVAWLCNAGANPAVHLTMNRTIRQGKGNFWQQCHQRHTDASKAHTKTKPKRWRRDRRHRRDTKYTFIKRFFPIFRDTPVKLRYDVGYEHVFCKSTNWPNNIFQPS